MPARMSAKRIELSRNMREQWNRAAVSDDRDSVSASKISGVRLAISSQHIITIDYIN